MLRPDSGLVRHQMFRFAQHLQSFCPLLAPHVDDAQIHVGSAGLRIRRQHLPEVALRFVQPALIQGVLSRLKKLSGISWPLQTRPQARHFAAWPRSPGEEVCADVAAATPASSRQPQLPTGCARLTLVSLSAVVSANLRIEFKREGSAVQDSIAVLFA
jgi:hypothetical protein